MTHTQDSPTATPPRPVTGTPRSLLIIAVGIVALVIVTIVVVLLAGSREQRQFPADSPEGVLQNYVAAYEADDLEAAYAYFSSEVQAEMSQRDFISADAGYGRGAPSRRVMFDRTSGSGDRVTLHLIIEEFYSGGIDSSTSRYPRAIRMVREPDGWRIDEPLVGLEPGPVFEAY